MLTKNTRKRAARVSCRDTQLEVLGFLGIEQKVGWSTGFRRGTKTNDNTWESGVLSPSQCSLQFQDGDRTHGGHGDRA